MIIPEWFTTIHPVGQALIATCFTWMITAAGAAVVFLFKTVNQRLLDGMMGFAAGVMIAASFWSLLAPSIEISSELGYVKWLPAAVGFLAGGLFILAIDKVLPHLHVGFPRKDAEGIQTSWHRSVLLVMAITLHNIPEGLAIGVAFGAVATDLSGATLPAAIALSLGIGLQNFPEGLSVAAPLRREGYSRFKSFWYGQMSALVEPVAGVIGAAAVLMIKPILPFALSFAAGAMIFVVIEELIPESQLDKNTDTATVCALVGFVIMMVLDVALG